MDKKEVYLDMNIYICCDEEESMIDELKKLKEEYDFVYSPAHIEEIYRADVMNMRKAHSKYREENEKRYYRWKRRISEITNNQELLPHLWGSIVRKNESPSTCLKRVKAIDTIDFLENFYDETYYKMLEEEYDKNEMSKEEILEILTRELNTIDRGNSHKCLERNLELIFNIFNKYNYKVTQKLSSVHDLTHCIYATHSYAFVTNDKNLIKRAIVAYEFLGIETRVMSYKAFKHFNTKILN